MIGCRETMTCTGKRACALTSVTFSLMVTFKCCAKLFLEMYNTHGLCNGHYVPLVSMLVPGKIGSIYRSILSALIEVAVHTVLKNAQFTFKNEL